MTVNIVLRLERPEFDALTEFERAIITAVLRVEVAAHLRQQVCLGHSRTTFRTVPAEWFAFDDSDNQAKLGVWIEYSVPTIHQISAGHCDQLVEIARSILMNKKLKLWKEGFDLAIWVRPQVGVYVRIAES